MASPDIPPSAAVGPPDPAVLRVRDQGELVGAVPVLIGFHPRESLVLLATGGESGRRLGLTLRIDLPPPERAARTEVEAVAASAVRGLLLDAPAGAAVVVVGARGGADPPHRVLVDRVVHALEGHGVDVHTAVWAESTTAGARWACYDPCGCVGTVPDPSSTPIAAAAVAGGQVVHVAREELERLVGPADAGRLRRREELLIRAVDEAASCCAAAAADPPATDVVAAVIDPAIADAAAGRLVLDDARVLALAAALVDPAVRDIALLRCAGPDAAAAEQLWTALVRETPGPEAAEPAALLAVSALLRGDGALANVALDRAERAWPGHRLTTILRSVTEAGLRPAQVRACLRRGSAGPGTSLGGSVATAATALQGDPPARRRITRGRRRPG
jgi:hypothetical protein